MKRIIFLSVFLPTLFSCFFVCSEIDQFASALDQIKIVPVVHKPLVPVVVGEPGEPVEPVVIMPKKPVTPRKKVVILPFKSQDVRDMFTELEELMKGPLGTLGAWRKQPIIKPKTELNTLFLKLLNNTALFENEVFKANLSKVYHGDPDDETVPSIWKKIDLLKQVSSQERKYRKILAEIAVMLNPDLKKSVDKYIKNLTNLGIE